MNTFQPDQKEIDDVFTKISAMNGKRGCFVNPNEKDAKQLVGALLVNKEKYGFQYCPCRLVLGDKKENIDIICPCLYRNADVAEYGTCFCGLYVSEEVVNGGKKIHSIPERRPKREERLKI